MNHLGSKRILSGFIYNVILNSVRQNLEDCCFCDLFAGTGVVGTISMTKLKVSFTTIGNITALLLTVHSLAKYRREIPGNAYGAKSIRWQGRICI